MQLVPFIDAGHFRWNPQPIRWSSKPILWAVTVVAACGAVLVLARDPAQPAPQFAFDTLALPYMSSDPTVPPADSVKFPDAQPQAEAF